MSERTPYHYYFATFTDDDVSHTTDTEPRYLRRYTILCGPYSTALDAWGDDMDAVDGRNACVMQWYGPDHVGTCYMPFSDDVETLLDASEIDHDALFNAITRVRYKPQRTSPGEYLEQTIAERRWTITYLAERAHLHPRVIEEVINNGRPITPRIAGRLALVLGTSPDLWLNLQRAYDDAGNPGNMDKEGP